MSEYDFGFSLSESSVNEINSLIEQYSEDVISNMNGFQDSLAGHVSQANYDKLLKAVDGIIVLYNDEVRTELKANILNQWQDSCETMARFAENMGMGEESEQVAREVEDALASVFESTIENRLCDIVVDGRTSASIVEFDNIDEVFESFAKGVRELSDDFVKESERLGEENEFYKFLSPVIEAYSDGIYTFFNDAKSSLNELEDNYVAKMREKRDAVQEATKEINLSDLLDLSDLAYDGMGSKRGGGGGASPATKQAEPPATKTQSADATKSPDSEPNHEQVHSAVIQALRTFEPHQCNYRAEEQKYKRKLQNYYDKLDAYLKADWTARDQSLKKYYAQLEKTLEKRYVELESRYIKGTITARQGNAMYDESCQRAQQLYAVQEQADMAEYAARYAQAHQQYENAEKNCKKKLDDMRKVQQLRCKTLHGKKQDLITRLSDEKNAGKALSELSALTEQISKQCTCQCGAITQLQNALGMFHEQEVYDGTALTLSRTITSKNENLSGFKRKKTTDTMEQDLQATNPNFYDQKKNPAGEYKKNCQRCVMAYEARRRGFDVTASKRLFTGDTLPTMSPTGMPSVFEDKHGNPPVPERVAGATTADAIQEIERKMALYGDGARAIISIGRHADDGSRTGGHVFIAEQRNGKTEFVDPQSGRANAMYNFGNKGNRIGVVGVGHTQVCNPRCQIPRTENGVTSTYTARLADCYYCTDVKKQGAPTQNITIRVRPQDIGIMRIDNLKMTKRINECVEK